MYFSPVYEFFLIWTRRRNKEEIKHKWTKDTTTFPFKPECSNSAQ